MGVVVVGPSGSGKTILWKLLRTALGKLDQVVKQYTMNPKAMPRTQVCVLNYKKGTSLLNLEPLFPVLFILFGVFTKNSLIIHEENTKKNHKRVVCLYVIEISLDLHKL